MLYNTNPVPAAGQCEEYLVALETLILWHRGRVGVRAGGLIDAAMRQDGHFAVLLTLATIAMVLSDLSNEIVDFEDYPGVFAYEHLGDAGDQTNLIACVWRMVNGDGFRGRESHLDLEAEVRDFARGWFHGAADAGRVKIVKV